MKSKNSVEKITTTILTTYRKFTKSNREPVKLKITLGRQLNDCKEQVKKDKKSWDKHAQEFFPHIKEKTRQRAMRIATLLDKAYSASIHLLGITTLYDLCPLCEPDGIEDFLKHNGIDLEFELNNQSVKNFQTSVTQLIPKSKVKKQRASKPGPPKQFKPWLINLEKKSRGENFSLTKKNVGTLKEYIKTISEIVERAEGR